MRLSLTWLDGEKPQVTMSYPDDITLIIGRAPTCDLRLHRREVSRYHSQILGHAGRFVIQDLGSTDGTWVNGALIGGHERLKAGDEIGLGKTRMTVDIVESGEVDLDDGTVLRTLRRCPTTGCPGAGPRNMAKCPICSGSLDG